MVFQAQRSRKIALRDAGMASRDQVKHSLWRERPEALFLRCLGVISPVDRAVCTEHAHCSSTDVPTRLATWARATSTASSLSHPNKCVREWGFP